MVGGWLACLIRCIGGSDLSESLNERTKSECSFTCLVLPLSPLLPLFWGKFFHFSVSVGCQFKGQPAIFNADSHNGVKQ